MTVWLNPTKKEGKWLYINHKIKRKLPHLSVWKGSEMSQGLCTKCKQLHTAVLNSFLAHLQIKLHIKLLHTQTSEEGLPSGRRKKEVQLQPSQHRKQKPMLRCSDELISNETFSQWDHDTRPKEVQVFLRLHPLKTGTMVPPVCPGHDIFQDVLWIVRKEGRKIKDPQAPNEELQSTQIDFGIPKCKNDWIGTRDSYSNSTLRWPHPSKFEPNLRGREIYWYINIAAKFVRYKAHSKRKVCRIVHSTEVV